ncbi:MAG: helix-turn-helix domain-containing protein [Eubacterium sp.]|nr:helix-turn-helix domain-containing protein [Eubacterium sp.]
MSSVVNYNLYGTDNEINFIKTIILNRLCRILDCQIEDIMEYVPDDET